MRSKSISDLVKAVDRHLRRNGETSPGVAALTELFEVVYFTSLKTEEGRPLQVRVALVDPSNPDPDRPPAPRPDRWKITKLGRFVELTVPNLVKLSKAADPWSSCLAAYYDSSGVFFIWGLIDQTVHFNTYLVHEKDFGYAPPGLFQILATGTADLSVFRAHEFVARLAQDTLSRRQTDVFWSGPISDRLDKGISPYIRGVLDKIPGKKSWPYVDERAKEFKKSLDWLPSIADTWISTLCRILISIQRYRHGGALLLSRSTAHLDIKYKISYTRLRTALTRYWVSRFLHFAAEGEIHDEFLDKDEDFLPVELYLDSSISKDDEEDLRDEITGCVRFVSSLSCIDGLILATPDLAIHGFGVEIRVPNTKRNQLLNVYKSPGPRAQEKSLKKIDPTHYGTRHRTMMRYCFAHPGSLGFVISQDGEIRAMTRVKDKLVMWENLKVLDFMATFKRAPVKKKSSSPSPKQPTAS